MPPRIKARAWCFTWNNYVEGDIRLLRTFFEAEGASYVFQEEIGESGTPHLQGVFRFKNPRAFQALHGVWPRMHLEKCKSWKASVVYCSDTAKRAGGVWGNIPLPEPVRDPLADKDLYPWQVTMKQLLEEDPDDRRVHWVWEGEGNVGKTSFAKSWCLNNEESSIYVGGKAVDVKYAIQQMKQKPKYIFWDVPRSQKDYVSYQGIEEVKNGIFFSGKYEGGMVMFNPPHVVIFANFMPDLSKLSHDRWRIWHIEVDTLVEL